MNTQTPPWLRKKIEAKRSELIQKEIPFRWWVMENGEGGWSFFPTNTDHTFPEEAQNLMRLVQLFGLKVKIVAPEPKLNILG